MAPKVTNRRGTSTRTAFAEEGKEIVAGFAGTWLIQLIPHDWVEKAAELLPDVLLTDNDTRLHWSRGISLALGSIVGLESAQRNALENFLVQSAEEVGKRRDQLDGKGSDKDHAVIREAMKSKKGLLEPLREKKENKSSSSTVTVDKLDYFQARAKLEKGSAVRERLNAIEAAFKKADPQAFERFMHKGAYTFHTSVDEITDIASLTDDAAIERLKSAMDSPRSKGSMAERITGFVGDIIDDVTRNRHTIEGNLTIAADTAKAWAVKSAKERAARKAV